MTSDGSRVVVQKPKGKGPLRRPRWVVVIKIYFKELCGKVWAGFI
jgi:hypothetical protein